MEPLPRGHTLTPPLHVAVLHLGFERVPAAADLLARFPLLGGFFAPIAATGAARVTVLGRFWRDEDLRQGGVDYRFRVDDPSCRLAGPLLRPTALYRLLDDLAPDVVHVNGMLFPLHVAELRCRLPTGTAIVVQHHGERPRRWSRTLAQRVLRGCVDGFLFSADGIADEWRRAGAIGKHQPVFEVLEASSPLMPRDRVESRSITGMSGDPAVLWVGRLHPRKSPLLALEAFDLARRALPDPRLFIVFQEDQLLPDVRAMCAARPGLAERVHLVGRVPHAQLDAWFSAADLFITTSEAEGSNIALIEALSCGLLPVCTDVPANRYVVAAGAAGVLFPYGDARRGAEALVQAAARSQSEGQALRTQLRAHFESRLSWPAVAQQALEAYRAALARRRR